MSHVDVANTGSVARDLSVVDISYLANFTYGSKSFSVYFI